MRNEKRKIVVSSITVAVLLVVAVASTYAYFQASLGSGSQTATSVTAKTVDGLVFNSGENILITATQDNFASGSGNITKSINPIVQLKARNDASASYNYTLCLNISQNDFVHSQVGTTNQNLGKTYNLFNVDALKEAYGYAITSIVDDTYVLPAGKMSVIKFSKLCPDCEAGTEYSLHVYGGSSGLWGFGTSAGEFWRWDGIRDNIENLHTLTEDEINSEVIFLCNGTQDCYFGKLAIKETGISAGEYGSAGSGYVEYGYIQNSELELVVKNQVTLETLLTKDITSLRGKICVPTTNGGTNTTHTITALAGATQLDLYNATVTLKNYNNSQNINEGKNFQATLDFTRVD